MSPTSDVGNMRPGCAAQLESRAARLPRVAADIRYAIAARETVDDGGDVLSADGRRTSRVETPPCGRRDRDRRGRRHGLVAANHLADAGWDVLVLEEQPEPGGAVRSGETAHPGYVHDRFSAFYPLVAASRVIRALDLERFGLKLRRAPAAVGNPLPGGRAALIYGGDLDRTCANLEALAPGDGEAFARWIRYWERIGPALLDALMSPFPPVRGALQLGAALRTPRAAGELARLGVLPVRRFAEEELSGEGARLLFAGNALHADFAPESPGSTIYGLVLVGLAQSVGFPAVEGGAGRLTEALVRRLEHAGGRLECGARAERVVIRGGRAAAVRTADGREHPAARAVLADVGAPQLFEDLVGAGAPPGPLPRRDAPVRVRPRHGQGRLGAQRPCAVDGAGDGRRPGPCTSRGPSTR